MIVKKVFIFLLVFISLVVLSIRFAYQPLISSLGLTPKAGLRIESDKPSQVFINHQEKGMTPFQNENLSEGEYLVEIRKKQGASPSANPNQISSWSGYVKLNAGTLSVVNRELGETPQASSGEVITLERGKGAIVISTPANAQVEIDGNNLGRTPISVTNLSSGEHQFLIGKESFLKRSIRATLVEGFKLTLNVDLAISEADLTKIPSTPISTNQEVVVKKTPTGFLRVRAAADITSQEVTKVKPGESLILLEQQPNWDRVRTEDGKEGYVSSAYVEKKTP